jgi:NitT/TauT family transport system substrate-binding protein
MRNLSSFHGRLLGLAAVGLVLATAACGGSSNAATGKKLEPFDVQLVWIPSNESLGENVALEKGFYADEGLDVTLTPGGPNIDGIASVASGKKDVGVIGSSPSLMMAVSAGIPLTAVASVNQQHPGAFVSRADDPIKTPQDMIGKTIGVGSTSKIHLQALLAKNNIPEDKVKVEIIGNDTLPVVTKQVDAAWAYVTNLAQLAPLKGEYNAMRLWDQGIRYYADVIYTSQSTLAKKKDQVDAYVRATAKGWLYAHENLEDAVDILVKAHPELDRANELAGAKILMTLMFNDDTTANGWGTMNAERWQEQLDLFDQLGQFKGKKPTVSDIMTDQVLKDTADARKVGATS